MTSRSQVIVVPTFFPSVSKNNDTWWGSQDTKTVYLWDSMDNQDRQNTLAKLETTSEWTIWKTRDKEWSQDLQKEGYASNIVVDSDSEMHISRVIGECCILCTVIELVV